jgi:hypothetical protein
MLKPILLKLLTLMDWKIFSKFLDFEPARKKEGRKVKFVLVLGAGNQN